MSQPQNPLAELFNNAQLTGLSKGKQRKSQLAPLDIEIPEPTHATVGHEVTDLRRKIKRPPRFNGEEYESRASDVEIEEVDSEDEENQLGVENGTNVTEETPSSAVSEEVKPDASVNEAVQQVPSKEDIQAKMKLMRMQQEMNRRRMAMVSSKDEAKQVTTSNASEPSAVENPIEDSTSKTVSTLPERIGQLAGKKSTPSAMDLFMAAMEQSENPPPVKSSQPQVKSQNVVPVKSAETTVEVPSSQEPRPLMGNRLILSLEAMIRTNLPLLKEFHVVNALDSFDRPLMKAIWTAHRTKFLVSGKLEYAVSALSVMNAFDEVPDGQLVAAYVETTASDYLIWVDLPHQKLVAAFANAGDYFGNSEH